MKARFADTAYFVALNFARDALHPRAVAESRVKQRIVTTEYILVETADFFAHPADRPAYLALVESLRTNPLVRIFPATTDLFARGLALFAARPDKEWSLTDCTSFVVMGDLGLADALTADRHFAQAGFRPALA